MLPQAHGGALGCMVMGQSAENAASAGLLLEFCWCMYAPQAAAGQRVGQQVAPAWCAGAECSSTAPGGSQRLVPGHTACPCPLQAGQRRAVLHLRPPHLWLKGGRGQGQGERSSSGACSSSGATIWCVHALSSSSASGSASASGARSGDHQRPGCHHTRRPCRACWPRPAGACCCSSAARAQAAEHGGVW